MNKQITTFAIAALAVVTLATGAMAYGGHMRGNGYGPGSCPGWNGAQTQALTPEQQEKFTAISDDFAAKMIPVRQEMMVKNAQLRAALMGTDIDSAEVEKLATEVASLKTRMLTMRIEMRKAMQAEGLPVNTSFGRGMRGMHHGYGQGMGQGMGRGMGYGMMDNSDI